MAKPGSACLSCWEREFCERAEDEATGVPPRERRTGTCGYRDEED